MLHHRCVVLHLLDLYLLRVNLFLEFDRFHQGSLLREEHSNCLLFPVLNWLTVDLPDRFFSLNPLFVEGRAVCMRGLISFHFYNVGQANSSFVCCLVLGQLLDRKHWLTKILCCHSACQVGRLITIEVLVSFKGWRLLSQDIAGGLVDELNLVLKVRIPNTA